MLKKKFRIEAEIWWPFCMKSGPSFEIELKKILHQNSHNELIIIEMISPSIMLRIKWEPWIKIKAFQYSALKYMLNNWYKPTFNNLFSCQCWTKKNHVTICLINFQPMHNFKVIDGMKIVQPLCTYNLCEYGTW